MSLKQKANHSLNEQRENTASKSRETLKEKIVVWNVDGIITELESFQGLVETKIQHKKVKLPFFKNRILVNGKKLNKRANLMDLMKEGAKVTLKVKPSDKTGRGQQFKIFEINCKDGKTEHNSASTSHSFSTKNNGNGFAEHGDGFWEITVPKLPYIDGAACTVLNLSDTTGIVLTDPDDNGACKVYFEINNLFINGEECKAKSLYTCLHMGQSLNCTATKVNDKNDIDYKAFAIWIGKRPLFAKMLSPYIPKINTSFLRDVTVFRATVKLLAPPKAALLALDPDNYAVVFLSCLYNIKPVENGWIGDYIQVGDTLLVKIGGQYQDYLCFSVLEACKVNDTSCKKVNEILGHTAEASSGNTASSSFTLNKSSQIASDKHKDTVRNKEVGWMQNMSYSISKSAKKNSKSPGNNGASRLLEENKPQSMKRTLFNGRTGQVMSYSSKSRGSISDYSLGHVKFHRAIVVFPEGLENLDLQEYIPVGCIVYYNACLLGKNQNYVCTKVWIGKKDRQPGFQNKSPLILECSNSELTEGETYKAVVFELRMPYGLIVTVETVDKGVLVFVPLRILQLYPEGPFIGSKCAAYIKCGDALFVNVHYKTDEKRLNWIASNAWISTSCAEFERQDAVELKPKKECMYPMSGKLALVSSNRGEISREFGIVFFSNKNAFLFEINLGQMDLQKVFIEGETLNFILPEDSNEMQIEACKVWYGTLDSKETLNQRIDALIGYWMKRGLDKPTLRAMIKELKRQHVEQNLQILPKDTEFNSMSTDDNNLSCFSSASEESALNKETKSDIEELKQQQNLKIVLRRAELSNSIGSNICYDRDVSAPIKETSLGTETEDKLKRHYEEQNLQVLPKNIENNTMSAGDNNFSFSSETEESVLNKITNSDIELQQQQNLQMVLWRMALNNLCSNGSSVCSDRDISVPVKQKSLGTETEDLKTHYAEQNLQILPKIMEYNSMSVGDNNFSFSSKREESALNRETKSDIELQQQQNLQMALWRTTLNNPCSNGSNICSDRDVSAPIKETRLGTETEDLKRHYVEQNLQILPKNIENNSMSAGDNNFSFSSEREESVLDKITNSDIKLQQQQNLQMALWRTTLNNPCSNGSNICSDRDVSAPIKETSLGTETEDLKRHYAEQNLQILPKNMEFNSVSAGDNFSFSSQRKESVLNKETKSDIELQQLQNLQMALWRTTLNNPCSNGSNICSDRDVSAPIKETSLGTETEDLKRYYAEQNLQILPKNMEFNSVSAGDNFSFSSKREESALNRETKSDIELQQQNLQMMLWGSPLSNCCSNICSDRDISVAVNETNIDETNNKIKTELHINDTQDLTESTMHSRSKVPIALNLPFSTGCGNQIMSSTDIFANRELSRLVFENKHLSVADCLEQKVLHGLLRFLRDGLSSPTVLQEIQIWQKAIRLKYNDEETLTHYLLKQVGFGRGQRQLSSVKDKKSVVVNLSEQEEHVETSGTNQYKLKKEKYVTVNQSNSVKSGGSKCVESLHSHTDAQCLLSKESNDVNKIPFQDGLQSNTEPMNIKIAEQKKYANKEVQIPFPDALQSHTEPMKNRNAKQKKYANKEVQTISTGDILYFKVAPDV